MWSRRAQEYEAKISSGKIYELAEVVRDLNKGDDLMVDQSYSERQLFEKAYERILSEFQIVMGVSLEDTQKKLDKALKRNLEGQAKAVAAMELEAQAGQNFLISNATQEGVMTTASGLQYIILEEAADVNARKPPPVTQSVCTITAP